MPQIGAPELAEGDAVGAEKASRLHLPRGRPARGAIGDRFFRFLHAPHRQADRDRDGCKAAGRGDDRALDKNPRRVSVKPVPPRPNFPHGKSISD